MSEEKAKIVSMPLASLTLDAGTQMRDCLDWQAVRDYAQTLRDGEKLPPIKARSDGENTWPSDGFHRVEAHLAAGLAHIDVAVKPGTLDDAKDDAAAANADHGVRRSRETVQRSIRSMLERHPDWSNRKIAQHCRVDPKTVIKLRQGKGVDNPHPADVSNSAGPENVQVSAPDESESASDADSEIGSAGSEVAAAGRGDDAEIVAPPEQPEAGGGDADGADAGEDPNAAPEPLTDEGGDPLPPQAAEAFAGLPELRKFCRALDDAAREAERLGKLPVGRKLHWQSVQSHIKRAREATHAARPARACPYCKTGKKLCRACEGHGWVTASVFNSAPKE